MGSNPAEDAISLLTPANNDLDNGLISKKNIYASYITWLDIAKPNDKKNSQGDRCYQFGSIEELKKVFSSKF